jgi:hypothetical protein
MTGPRPALSKRAADIACADYRQICHLFLAPKRGSANPRRRARDNALDPAEIAIFVSA